jgi:hypothetical protein
MDFILFLSNILIILLVLIRVPNINTAAMDIDQNPKFLNPAISFLTSVFLINMVYGSIVA